MSSAGIAPTGGTVDQFFVTRRAALAASCALVSAMVSASETRADDYPNRIITVIVPAAAGGPLDMAARIVVDGMSHNLGQQLVVENVPGAGGNTGTARAKRAAPDGYTLLMNQTGMMIAPSLYAKLPFDVARDFIPIGLVNTTYSFLVGRKDLPASTLAELVTWMKGPGKPVKFAHPGVGTLGHLMAVMTGRSLDVELDLIPYRGGGPAMNDIVGRHVDLVWASTATAEPILRSGVAKTFGFGGPKRDPAVPDAPAFTELGHPELVVPFWHALYAPAGTPMPIAQRLNAALRATLADPQVKKTYAESGVDQFPMEQQTQEAAAAYVTQQLAYWTKTIHDNHIQGGL
jgi:tripartite-type tricarboxylate transporter receptor subunit TctC